MKIAAIMSLSRNCYDEPKTAKVRDILKEKGWEVYIEVEPTWTGYMAKVHWAHKCARELTQYTHLMLIDARDVVLLGTPEQVMERFLAFNHPWVCAAEPHIWPQSMFKPEDYPECEGPFRYLNSGAFIAEREYLLECLDRWPAKGTPETTHLVTGARCEDGPFYTGYYLADPGSIRLDHGCELFQCMCGSVWMSNLTYGDLHNWKMDTHPLVVHFNGGANIMDADHRVLWEDPELVKAKNYVGMPQVWEQSTRHQIDTLMESGLEPRHTLLEVGAGIFSVGKQLIDYLEPGHYWAVEPNKWLVSVSKIDRKTLHLYTFSDFRLSRTKHTFDYVFAHSILTHADQGMVRTLLAEASKVLNPGGRLIASFYDPNCGDSTHEGWLHPAGCSYTAGFINKLAEEAGFVQVKNKADPRHPILHTWLFARKRTD